MNYNLLSKSQLIKLIKEKDDLISEFSKDNYFNDLKFETDLDNSDHQLESTKFLKSVFEKGSYRSLRYFSSTIGLSPGKVSEIFSGKRRITQNFVDTISNSDSIPKEDIEALRDKVQKEVETESKVKKELHAVLGSSPQSPKQLDLENFECADDWTFYAIMSLLDAEKSTMTLEWIASSLNIEEQVARPVLDHLVSMGTVDLVDGNYSKAITEDTYNGDNNPSGNETTLRNRTKAILKKSIEVYDELPLQTMGAEADYINFSILADPKRIEPARKMLANYLYKVALFLEDGDKKQVYYLNSQLFPVSKKF